MADDLDTMGDAGGDVDLRACAYCGAAIDPRCHRCSECGGHVGLAWKTVDSELFGLVFSMVLIGVGCLVSWSQVRPSNLNGVSTIRGSAMLALSVYGLFVGVMNLLFRRHVIWPMLLTAILALWTGLGALTDVMRSAAWKDAGERASKGGMSFLEQYVGVYLRTIPPGFLLMLAGGALVMMVIVKGLVAGAGSAAAKSKAEAEAKAAAAAERKARRTGRPTDAPPPPEPPPTA